MLKPWSLDQKTGEEKMFIKAGWKLDRITTEAQQIHIYRGLMKKAW